MKYLDLTGLREVWDNIKSYISSKIPTKTSQLQNDSNYATTSQLPSKTSQLTNDSGFLTSTDISNKANKATTLSGYGITDAYTKTQVDKKVSNLVNSAPETLDTLNELASALGNDPNFATTVANQIGAKANNSDVVHKSGDETIAGSKTFTDRMFLKSSTFERGNLPSTNVIEDREFELHDKNNKCIFSILNYYFTDGNGKSVMYAYNPNTTNYNRIGISFDFDNINSQRSFAPFVNDDHNLGTPKLKWKNVYATTFHGNLVGNADTATKATNNASGNELSNDIIKGLSVSGKVITYTKLDGSTGTITTQDTNTDTKVTNTLGNTTKAYITGTTSAKTNTGTQIFDSGVYLTTTAGQLHADIDFPITEAQIAAIVV